MVMEQKKQMRQEVYACQNGLTADYMREADRTILEQVTSLAEYCAADTIFCFVSAGREIDTRRLIRHALDAGKRVGVPLCTGKGLMEVRQISGPDSLKPGKYGIPEPVEGCPLIAPEAIRLAIVPCATCSHAGMRLGHGGGYYDRYLARIRCKSVCVCREAVTREAIPLEPHDCPVDLLITERGVFRPGDQTKQEVPPCN